MEIRLIHNNYNTLRYLVSYNLKDDYDIGQQLTKPKYGRPQELLGRSTHRPLPLLKIPHLSRNTHQPNTLGMRSLEPGPSNNHHSTS